MGDIAEMYIDMEMGGYDDEQAWLDDQPEFEVEDDTVCHCCGAELEPGEDYLCWDCLHESSRPVTKAEIKYLENDQ